MRRFARHILNGLTVLSMLLCVAMCVLWVRSYWREDQVAMFLLTKRIPTTPPPATESVSWFPHEYQKGISTRAGSGVGISYLSLGSNEGSGLSTYCRWSVHKDVLAHAWYYQTLAADKMARMRWDHETDTWHCAVLFRDWFAASLLAVLPLFRVGLWNIARHRKRANSGCCVSCGYDLRASPDLCPECGMARKNILNSN